MRSNNFLLRECTTVRRSLDGRGLDYGIERSSNDVDAPSSRLSDRNPA
ncbi:MAG: hypothetical protein HC852_17590 [Acaryochloridaceae cyanobacterium RU_4_10]|nr:hypothetical protein [Acaryochloridaceae cyanobacterium RU_4_10]